jgi:hypothetical protein
MIRQPLVKSVFGFPSQKQFCLGLILSLLVKTRALLYCSVLCLSACSSTQEAPVGIGSGTDDLKQSPCAVCEKEPFYSNGRWIN